MQNEYGLLEPDCVHSAVCSIRVVFNDLQHSGASEALERLCSIVCFAVLSEVQSVTEEFSYRNRKRIRSFLLLPIQTRGFSVTHIVIIP